MKITLINRESVFSFTFAFSIEKYKNNIFYLE